MQIIQGMATDTVQIRDMARQVPARMLKFLKRIARLEQGKYVIIFSVGQDGDIMWQVNEAGKVER